MKKLSLIQSLVLLVYLLFCAAYELLYQKYGVMGYFVLPVDLLFLVYIWREGIFSKRKLLKRKI